MGPKVVLLEDRFENHEPELAVLRALGADVVEAGHARTEDEIIAVCGDAEGITVNLARITERVIGALDRCRAIARYGVGYDNVDVAAATRRGIKVVNVPDYCAEDVSDHAMALFLGCVRKIARRDREVRTGKWNVGRADPVYRIKGKTFGLVGYGGIARALHRKLRGFELGRVLVADPFVSPEVIVANGAEPVELGVLLREADYISLHAPLGEKTRGMIGPAQFEAMKPTAILINTSRGPIVDDDALYRALASGRIDSAGLDAHAREPLEEGSRYFALPNVILTDHTGWYSEESQQELQTKCAQNLASVLKGEPCYAVVNG